MLPGEHNTPRSSNRATQALLMEYASAFALKGGVMFPTTTPVLWCTRAMRALLMGYLRRSNVKVLYSSYVETARIFEDKPSHEYCPWPPFLRLGAEQQLAPLGPITRYCLQCCAMCDLQWAPGIKGGKDDELDLYLWARPSILITRVHNSLCLNLAMVCTV